MERMALRIFTRRKDSIVKPTISKIFENVGFPRIITFDTETTEDEYLNLKFGSFTVHENDIFLYGGLFWDNRHVSERDYGKLRKYAEEHSTRLFSLEEFINIFYLEVYERETLCIGYNINFDLSRIILE